MIVHKPSNSLLLNLREPERVRRVIPKSRLVNIDGHNFAVKHGVEEVKVLRNLGIDAPSPIEYYYDWPGRHVPFKHQIATSAFLTLHHRSFVLNEMGLGKTNSALWTADYLMAQGLIHKVLVISPLSTLERVWRDEIFSTLMHRTAVTLHGSRANRLKSLATDSDFYILNHDGVKIIGKEINARQDIDLVIIDEGSVYRNAQSERYKKLRDMLRPDMRLWVMTGTPCPNDPTDAWALARLVNPANVPPYFTQWKRDTMMQLSTYKWVPRPESYQKAYDALQPGIRFKKSDCLDLPPLLIEDRECELTKSQTTALKSMAAEYAMEMNNGTVITAVNAADRVGKMRQVLCGCIKTGEGEYFPLDFAPRISLLLECISEANAKVIVVVPFKGIIKYLEEEVAKHHTCAVLNGDVTAKKRNEIISQFKHSKDPHILLCHPKVMSHGLTLTEADTLIFYAPIYSNDEYQQVKDRINRPGQKRNMVIIRMAGHPIEWNIYKALDNKGLNQNSILEMYRDAVRGLT